MAASLASPADLADYLGREVDDVAAALVLAGVSALVRSYCGWVIAPAETDVVMVVDGSGARVQPLPTRHLTDVSRVVDHDSDVALSEVQWSEAGYLYRTSPFTTRLRGVSATVSHGFDTVPPEVVNVVLSVAVRGVDNPTAMTQYTVGNVSVTYSNTSTGGGPVLQPLEQAVLNRYRIFGTV